MNLTPEQRAAGKSNYQAALELTRREFLGGSAAALAISTGAVGAFYFNYGKVENPVRVGVIGTGDEGGVLMSNINPEYIQVVAVSDIRPYSIWRAFNGDQSTPGSYAARMGLMKKYGWKSEDEARRKVKVYENDYKELLKDPAVEMVIIALPLHLHAQVAIDALAAGKHVLTEKLMAHNIGECKKMSAAAKEHGKLLAVGHQRHYSVLYDDAVDLIRQGVIGNVHAIRAQWHRADDTWSPKLPDALKKDLENNQASLANLDPKAKDYAAKLDALNHKIKLLTEQIKDAVVDAKSYGYQDFQVRGKDHSALEELIRWRLWNRTGGGLMAELGSHQLDASSIFISAAHPLGDDKKPKKIRPLSVQATGGIHLYDKTQREAEDHVYCMYEFPGPEYEQDNEKKIVVTYSSINGNDCGSYGETVMGFDMTLMLEREQETLLLPVQASRTKEKVATYTAVSVEKKPGGAPVADSYETGGGASASSAGGKRGPVSRGYTEEMEHFAYLLRNGGKIEDLRCNPKVAMADAIIALTTNIAIRQNRRIEFKPEWFDLDNPATPEEDLKKTS